MFGCAPFCGYAHYQDESCTGTYLFGPDEMEKMLTIGNLRGEDRYGTEKVSPDASKESKQQHVVDKYEKRLFVGRAKLASRHANSVVQKMDQVRQKAVLSEPCGHAATNQRNEFANRAPKAQQNSQSLFDELFNETQETHFVDEVVVAKPGDIAVETAFDHDNNNNLDGFLDSVLLAQSTYTKMTNSTLLSSAALNQVTETTPFAEDPFFDWAF